MALFYELPKLQHFFQKVVLNDFSKLRGGAQAKNFTDCGIGVCKQNGYLQYNYS